MTAMRFQVCDGKIIIETGAGLYIAPRADFVLDNGADVSAFPEGMAGMEADGAGRVVFYDAKQNAFPLPEGHSDIAAWNGRALALGDKVAMLLAAKAAREAE